MPNGSNRLFLFRRKSTPIFVIYSAKDIETMTTEAGTVTADCSFAEHIMSLMPKQLDLMRLTGEPLKAYLQTALQSPLRGPLILI